jgi:hypothetical protein
VESLKPRNFNLSLSPQIHTRDTEAAIHILSLGGVLNHKNEIYERST